MARALVVDDDPHIRELVLLLLRNAGIEADGAIDGVEALGLTESTRFDVSVVDVMMPRMDGWRLCRELKARSDAPVLMLTARGESAQKVKGFELGADDYLVKPFDPPELVARVRSLLRRYKIEESQSVQVGRLRLDRREFVVYAGGEPSTLPRKEFDLLFKLGSYPGRTFTREHLIEELWGPDFEGTERTVDVHVNRLRDRFPEERFGFRISAIRGLGYRLETLA